MSNNILLAGWQGLPAVTLCKWLHVAPTELCESLLLQLLQCCVVLTYGEHWESEGISRLKSWLTGQRTHTCAHTHIYRCTLVYMCHCWCRRKEMRGLRTEPWKKHEILKEGEKMVKGIPNKQMPRWLKSEEEAGEVLERCRSGLSDVETWVTVGNRLTGVFGGKLQVTELWKGKWLKKFQSLWGVLFLGASLKSMLVLEGSEVGGRDEGRDVMQCQRPHCLQSSGFCYRHTPRRQHTGPTQDTFLPS